MAAARAPASAYPSARSAGAGRLAQRPRTDRRAPRHIAAVDRHKEPGAGCVPSPATQDPATGPSFRIRLRRRPAHHDRRNRRHVGDRRRGYAPPSHPAHPVLHAPERRRSDVHRTQPARGRSVPSPRRPRLEKAERLPDRPEGSGGATRPAAAARLERRDRLGRGRRDLGSLQSDERRWRPLPGDDKLRPEVIEQLISADEIARRVGAIGSAIRAEAGSGEVFLLGILKGASVFPADLMRAIDGAVTYGFIDVVRDEADTGVASALQIDFVSYTNITGRDVYVVKDIVSTGVIESYLLAQLRLHAPKSLHLVALLDRPGLRTVDLAVDFTAFETDGGSYVGYGLELDAHHGNLPWIGRIIESR